MTFYSQGGSVGVRTQSAKGSYTDPGAGGIFMRTTGGALTAVRDLMIPNPEIGGNRDVPDALMGPVKFAGAYDFYARMDSLATWLYGGFGAKSSSSAGSGATLIGTHVIKQIDGQVGGGAIPWLSIEENVGNGYEHYHYTDVKVNTLHLEAAADGYLLGNVGLVGLTQVAGASATAAPTTDISPLMVGTNITMSFGGVQLPAKSFKIDLNNNLEDDDFRLGSLFLANTVEKRRELTLGAKIRPEDHTLLRQALYGDPSAVTPKGTVVKSSVALTCQTYEFIGSTSTLYSVTFNIGVAAIKPFAPSPSGDDAIEHDIEIEALRPDPTVDLLTCTVVNHQAQVL